MKAFRLLLFILSITCAANIYAQTVYTTKTGEKYHKSTCRYLKYSKKEYSLEKAQSLGYSACSVCKPTANNTKIAKITNSNALISNTSTKKATASQCTGKTQSGARCKRKTKNSSGRCYQHPS
ncbi:hypothetical protein [Thalassobellus suaedae]|uniref:Uncharacterized protein n=1 Tax=Thalassobellus suaedae TaxID=3074124 RepID=A0ABY9XVN1_9FLAO|nr:hypothetical protein RHP51_04140 [Flavobacteriaceae bacterium HL-DH14]